jgi:hypothetical protein
MLFNVNWLQFEKSVILNAFSQIEAESFNGQSGVQISGNCVAYIENNDSIRFNNIDFGSGANIFNANVDSGGTGGNIEVWIEGIDNDSGGTKIGSCGVQNTGDWNNWVTKTCAISQTSGIHNVFLKFIGETWFLFNIDSFQFNVNSQVNFSSYNVSNNIITKVNQDKSVTDFINSLSPTGNVAFAFKDVSNQTITGAQLIGTGTTVDITINSIKTTYTILIYGDVNGDGKISLTDLTAIRDNLLEISTLTGVLKSAGDLYGEGNITLNDLVGVMAYISEASSINQNP